MCSNEILSTRNSLICDPHLIQRRTSFEQTLSLYEYSIYQHIHRLPQTRFPADAT